VIEVINSFPRFIFLFQHPDDGAFVNCFLDIAPECIWIDMEQLLEASSSDLRLKPKDLHELLRMHDQLHIGNIALDYYRQDLEGDLKTEQVIVTGPLEVQDMFPFSRVYGHRSVLRITTKPDPSVTAQTIVEMDLIRTIRLHETNVLDQVGEVTRQWVDLERLA